MCSLKGFPESCLGRAAFLHCDASSLSLKRVSGSQAGRVLIHVRSLQHRVLLPLFLLSC